VDEARLFALLNIALADAGIAAWDPSMPMIFGDASPPFSKLNLTITLKPLPAKGIRNEIPLGTR
jgi:hypothetical protein